MSIRRAYDDWSGSYDSNDNRTRDLDARTTREALEGERWGAILEIGCGTGKNTSFLASIADQVHAVDFSEGMISEARRKVTEPHVRFGWADLTEHWPCDDRAYDLIVSCLVLEHVEDLSHVFREAARVLRTNGRFLVNELHPQKQYGGTTARFERDGKTIPVEAFVHHLSDFTTAAFASGFDLRAFRELWHDEDEGKPPRLASLLFEKRS